MYRDEILDLYRNPRNEGSLDTDFVAEAENPSCGDDTTVYVKVEDGEIREVSHETDGCAISTAAASIVSEKICGMSVEKVLELDREWMLEKLGIDVSPMRMKCAMLGLKTAQEALAQE
ncbi:MAG: iron-sulfur cluster assembly scaffold protein [Candidatus Nanohaloarchaea archaeon]